MLGPLSPKSVQGVFDYHDYRRPSRPYRRPISANFSGSKIEIRFRSICITFCLHKPLTAATTDSRDGPSLEAQGIPMRDRPWNPTSWPQIYITDPDGNVIELNAATREDVPEG